MPEEPNVPGQVVNLVPPREEDRVNQSDTTYIPAGVGTYQGYLIDQLTGKFLTKSEYARILEGSAAALSAPQAQQMLPNTFVPAYEAISQNIRIPLLAGGVIVAAGAAATQTKIGRRVLGRVFGRRRVKRKRSRSSNRSKGRKLKFGTKAWRKRFMKKRTKSGKRTKGHNPFGEVESKENIGMTHRVGTEAQYKKRGGAKVYHTKNGQPYIILSTGRARFLKKSKR